MKTYVYLFYYLDKTSRKIAGSIPDGITVSFQSLNPSGPIVALGSTQPSTRNSSWG